MEDHHVDSRVHVVRHPWVQHRLTQLRCTNTPSRDFRRLVREISHLMAYEMTRNLPLSETRIDTPVASMQAPTLAARARPVVVGVLRAGLGMIDGFLDLMPEAQVGHIGLYRDPTSLKPVEYYSKLPTSLRDRDVFLVDPMLATGHSAARSLCRLKKQGATAPSCAFLIAAPEGVRELLEQHPDISIWLGALDPILNDHGYIVPGLGDAGDRLFDTLDSDSSCDIDR